LGDDFDAGDSAFLDTAAVMKCVDLVIICDTSIAHLGGALGCPTWVLIKEVADWRWLLNRADTAWCPTMRLFRRSQRGDWETVFEEVSRELAIRRKVDNRGDSR
jgi:ADP-heptose:LPS heptosyltransferase